MILLSIFLFLLLSISIFINVNLYKKYDKLEELSSEMEESLNETNEFISSLRKRVMSQRSYLNQLDRRGAFESDDEVGYFFKELKKIVKDISIFLEDDSPSEENIKQNLSNQFNGRIQWKNLR